MKKTCLLFTIALVALISGNSANAHGGFIDHFSFGINLGHPGFYGGYGMYDPFYYPPPVYMPPVAMPMAPPVIVQPAPPVYIQQQGAAPTKQSHTYDWYYCQNPEGYYPYIRQCPGGWLRVDPRPPGQ